MSVDYDGVPLLGTGVADGTGSTSVAERRRTLRALVVEDDEAILNLVRRVVERENFSVESTKSGGEAIRLLKSVAYDLLILDLKLPYKSGEKVIFLEDAQPRALRRVIVMTASPRQLSCEFLERICKILAKPFDIDERDGTRMCTGGWLLTCRPTNGHACAA
jgi:CheY-like chemotaxis protein